MYRRPCRSANWLRVVGFSELMRHVAEREHDGLQVADGFPVVQYDFLPAVPCVANVDSPSPGATQS